MVQDPITRDLTRRFKMFPLVPNSTAGVIALMYRGLAQALGELPAGRERSKALNRLEESMM